MKWNSYNPLESLLFFVFLTFASGLCFPALTYAESQSESQNEEAAADSAHVSHIATADNLHKFELSAPKLTAQQERDYVLGILAEEQLSRLAEDTEVGDGGFTSMYQNSPTLVVEFYEKSSRIGKQFLLIREYGRLKYAFAVSGAREGKWTPKGTFPIIKQRWRHMSGSYPGRGENNMDHASYFRPVYAFHSTTFGAYKNLGSRASAGCLRMGRPQARVAYGLVKKHLPRVQFKSFSTTEPSWSDVPVIREALADDLNFIQEIINVGNKGDTPFTEYNYFRYLRGELSRGFIREEMRKKGIRELLEVDLNSERVPQ